MGKQKRSGVANARRRLVRAIKEVSRLDPKFLRIVINEYRENNSIRIEGGAGPSSATQGAKINLTQDSGRASQGGETDTASIIHPRSPSCSPPPTPSEVNTEGRSSPLDTTHFQEDGNNEDSWLEIEGEVESEVVWETDEGEEDIETARKEEDTRKGEEEVEESEEIRSMQKGISEMGIKSRGKRKRINEEDEEIEEDSVEERNKETGNRYKLKLKNSGLFCGDEREKEQDIAEDIQCIFDARWSGVYKEWEEDTEEEIEAEVRGSDNGNGNGNGNKDAYNSVKEIETEVERMKQGKEKEKDGKNNKESDIGEEEEEAVLEEEEEIINENTTDREKEEKETDYDNDDEDIDMGTDVDTDIDMEMREENELREERKDNRMEDDELLMDSDEEDMDQEEDRWHNYHHRHHHHHSSHHDHNQDWYEQMRNNSRNGIPTNLRDAVPERVTSTWSEGRERVVLKGEDGRILILVKPPDEEMEGIRGREPFSLKELKEDEWSDWEGE